MAVLWHGLRDALLMGWQVWWALVIGFAISGIVQAWVPRTRITATLSGSGPRPVALATGLGAASSSCSYAAAAIGKSLFQRGASAATTLAFQFASTNLVWELGLVLWVLIGWRFALAEWLGGVVMIVLGALAVRVLIPAGIERAAREQAIAADTGHMHHSAGDEAPVPLKARLRSVQAWSDVAHNFRGDWQMLWKEIGVGLLISGFVAQIHDSVFSGLFLHSGSGFVQALWGALIGPVIAVATFVCSVGNVPLAAVLWSGGISFAGVVAFLFADVLIVPLLLIYRRYYGTRFTRRYVAAMVIAIIGAALIIEGIFSAVGLVPHGPRPLRADVFSGVHLDYKLVLNVVCTAIFLALMALTVQRGVTDPVCGMTVDRARSIRADHGGHTHHFCCAECRDQFLADPDRFGDPPVAVVPQTTATAVKPSKHTMIDL